MFTAAQMTVAHVKILRDLQPVDGADERPTCIKSAASMTPLAKRVREMHEAKLLSRSEVKGADPLTYRYQITKTGTTWLRLLDEGRVYLDDVLMRHAKRPVAELKEVEFSTLHQTNMDILDESIARARQSYGFSENHYTRLRQLVRDGFAVSKSTSGPWVRVMDDLRKAGLISRKNLPGSEAIWAYEITRKGREFLDATAPFRDPQDRREKPKAEVPVGVYWEPTYGLFFRIDYVDPTITTLLGDHFHVEWVIRKSEFPTCSVEPRDGRVPHNIVYRAESDDFYRQSDKTSLGPAFHGVWKMLKGLFPPYPGDDGLRSLHTGGEMPSQFPGTSLGIRPKTAREKHPHYHKEVPKGATHLDVYRILEMFGVTSPNLQHALKKLLVAGGRGAGKDIRQDVREAVDTLERWLEMRLEDEHPIAHVTQVNVTANVETEAKLRAAMTVTPEWTEVPTNDWALREKTGKSFVLKGHDVLTADEVEMILARRREKRAEVMSGEKSIADVMKLGKPPSGQDR